MAGSEPNVETTYSSNFAAKIYKDLYTTLAQSTVIDSRGEFFIIRNLAVSERTKHLETHLDDVTLVTQGSADNLHHLLPLIRRWKGLISVAVFASSPDQFHAAISVIGKLQHCFLPIRQYTTFHLVYPIRLNSYVHVVKSPLPRESFSCNLPTSGTINYGQDGVVYPVNLLRNVAREAVPTHFVFVIDIDMVPNANLRTGFLAFIHKTKLLSLSTEQFEKIVYVVPAFEVKDGMLLADDKSQLKQQIWKNEARSFYQELCPMCQALSDYESWLSDNSPTDITKILYEVSWLHPYEPFYIAHQSLPLYDERFRQYGFNRVSQLCEMHIAGYRFLVLNNAFTLHKGYKTTSIFYSNKEKDHVKNRQLYDQFKMEIKEKYNSSRIC